MLCGYVYTPESFSLECNVAKKLKSELKYPGGSKIAQSKSYLQTLGPPVGISRQVRLPSLKPETDKKGRGMSLHLKEDDQDHQDSAQGAHSQRRPIKVPDKPC